MLSFAVFFPILAGLLLFLIPEPNRKLRCVLVELIALLTSAAVFSVIFRQQGTAETVFPIVSNLVMTFSLDGTGAIFAGLAAFLWPIATLYGFEYMRHEGRERAFFALYTVSYGVTLGVAMAGNLVTLYIFYELLSLSTLPLVMHSSRPEAVRAGRIYMAYTFGGAALALIGVIPVIAWGGGNFVPGGALEAARFAQNPVLMQGLFLCMALGFGVKAAIVPFHRWLPEAAVAPTPVTALLHAAAVVKAGAFAVIRVCYFTFGSQNLYGTPAQAVLIILAALTIVYGAVRAVREHHLKRRLAWSTVSNLSYIVFSAALLTPAGMTGALAHLVFHALIKITLFYCAGAILVQTGRTQIESMRGLRARMPLVCGVYAIAALALAGTPMLPAFLSKWTIGNAALAVRPFGLVGLIAMLISAVLCAVYVLYPVFFMIFRSPDESETGAGDPGLCMKTALVILTLAIVLIGFYSNQLLTFMAAQARM
ncbi:MAG: proton-conducting membrane transporter [Clostridia bacterium]|nr:proton-conducting membrane transporter [Clostridia bacterium]